MSGLVANYESGEEPSPAPAPAADEYDPLAAAAAAPETDEAYDPLAAAGDEYAGYAPDGGDGEPPAKRARSDEAPAAEVPDEAPAEETNVALVARLQDYVARGLDPTEEIRKNRDFHNPMLLEKIVRYYDIDDIASQFPKHLFDPEAIVARRSKGKKQAPSSPRADTSAPMTALPLPPPS
jgi:hypothetical protein